MSLRELTKHYTSNSDLTEQVNLSHLKGNFEQAGVSLMNLMSVSGVITDRSTHYNSKEEEQEAMRVIHESMFSLDRGLYLLVHALDGATDFSRQKAITALLSNSRAKYRASVLDDQQEMLGIKFLSGKLPANRLMNLFVTLKNQRVNNPRTKKRLILESLFDDPDQFCFWCVKYRSKVKKAITHAWDERTSGIVNNIIKKLNFDIEDSDLLNSITYREASVLSDCIVPYMGPAQCSTAFIGMNKIIQGVAFVFGQTEREDYSVKIFQDFQSAKEDLSKGENLPIEVLEGIRSTYHPEVKQEEILKTAEKSMTSKKRMLTQKKSEKLGVDVKFDPMTANPVDLYKLAYANGMTEEMWTALMKKAKKASEQLPIRFNKVGILIDDSFSMSGGEDQKLRPISVSMAVKDVLGYTSEDKPVIMSASGLYNGRRMSLAIPNGETNLADSLLNVLSCEVDSVFILSDGYENSPAGRLDEVVRAARSIGVDTPIYHINPVSAGESSSGQRMLSEVVPTLPAASPGGLGMMLFRAMMEVDAERGIKALINMTLPKISNNGARRIEQ